MWLRRTKSKAPSPLTSPTFSRSSFKDIESLFAEENNNNSNSNDNTNDDNTSSSNCDNSSPKSKIGSIFHRVRLAKSLFWALATQPKIEENNQESGENLRSLGHGDKDVNVVGNVCVDDGVVRNQEHVQELMQTSNSLHHEDKGVDVVVGNVNGDDGIVRNQENVQELMQTSSKSLDYGCKDDGVVPIEENVQESVDKLRSLHHLDKDVNVVGNVNADDRVVRNQENVQKLMQTSKSLSYGCKDDGAVPIEDNAQESIQTLKSLQCGGKDDGVVGLERVGSEGNGCLVEEATERGEVGSVNVIAKEDVVPIELPGMETRVVIFFTSLRAVRPTFLDCKYVRTILQSFDVAIDERDLFMDGSFMVELQKIMGNNEKTNLTLPQVFIGGRYIGGAEEIRELHEAGELKKYMEGMAPAPAGTCEVCGGHRFILCLECNGSHKRYADKGGLKGGYKTCTGCNENGLVRCPSCSCAPP